MQDIIQFYNSYFKPGNVCTDSRKIKPGDIFIALSGQNFNGNEYAKQAIDKGAAIAVVDDQILKGNKNFYVVSDSLTFLQNLANYHRKNSKFHVIGITGSNGKTTTKELIKAILAKKYSCVATRGNLNNHIGVPLTLLSIPSETEFAIIEMGANHQGEIEHLCKIASPDSGLITNIGKAHLEGFGSFEGVIKAKSELYEHLRAESGKVYLNGADNILSGLMNSYKNKIIYNELNSVCYGETVDSDSELTINLKYNSKSHFIIRTQLYGDYNLTNILAAACIGVDLNVSYKEINSAIEDYKPIENRSQILQFEKTKIILDCYNANPTSMQQALTSFSKLKSNKKLVILGGMKELGPYSNQEHKKLIDLVRKFKFSETIFIGQEFSKVSDKSLVFFNSFNELKEYIKPQKLSGYTILVKGSRANQLERVTGLFDKQ